MQSERSIEDYVSSGHREVKGWITDSSLGMTVGIARLQERNQTRGGICEIGVHHGRFFIALAMLRRAGEHAHAIDVFDMQERNPDGSGHGNLGIFKRNLSDWGVVHDVSIRTADSLDVRAEDLRAGFGDAGVRLFSVDGSHTARHTTNDILLAEQVLSDGGVILVDDFPNGNWPGVMEAVVQLLASGIGGLAPVCYGGGKLVLAQLRHHAAYLDFTRERLGPLAHRVKAVELCGHPCFHIGFENPERLLHAA